jgi:hypothetical protein
MENEQIPQPPIATLDRDPCLIKCHIDACISALRDEDGRAKSRELALAVVKLQEATMWIDEHLRLS